MLGAVVPHGLVSVDVEAAHGGGLVRIVDGDTARWPVVKVQGDAVGALGSGAVHENGHPVGLDLEVARSLVREAEAVLKPRGDLKARESVAGCIGHGGVDRSDEGIGDRDGGRCRRGVGYPQELVELARFEHLRHDIGPTNELLVHVKLGNGGPVAVVLDALANLGIGQDIHRLELNTEGLQRAQGSGAEATLWHLLVSLHEQDDLVFGDDVLDGAADV